VLIAFNRQPVLFTAGTATSQAISGACCVSCRCVAAPICASSISSKMRASSSAVIVVNWQPGLTQQGLQQALQRVVPAVPAAGASGEGRAVVYGHAAAATCAAATCA
jgi:hypothetical protein